MALTKTPVCDFGKKAEDFKLKSIENKLISLNDVKGKKENVLPGKLVKLINIQEKFKEKDLV